MSDGLVRNNEAARRSELTADDQTAVPKYLLEESSIVFVNTDVPENFKVRESLQN